MRSYLEESISQIVSMMYGMFCCDRMCISWCIGCMKEECVSGRETLGKSNGAMGRRRSDDQDETEQ